MKDKQPALEVDNQKPEEMNGKPAPESPVVETKGQPAPEQPVVEPKKVEDDITACSAAATKGTRIYKRRRRVAAVKFCK